MDSADITGPEEALDGKSLMETLLTPTKIYVRAITELMKKVEVKSAAHITGGGFYENIPRALPAGLSAKIKKDDVRVLPIFDLIAERGRVSEHDMYNTFNMGVGMTCIVDAENVDEAIEILKENGEEPYVLGKIVESEEGVILE